jgi:FtsZ-binding cell division protein ZapB
MTSRKEVPSVFARKRARTQAFGDDEDELLEELRPDATELEQIEYKRRQNTVAARRSRKRKLEFQQKLIDNVEHLSRERDVWRERARMLQGMMEARGLPCPVFPPDEDES